MSSDPNDRNPEPPDDQAEQLPSQLQPPQDTPAQESLQTPADQPVVLAQFADSPAPLVGQSLSADQAMGHLHPTSLAFDLLSHVRSLIFPAVLGLFGAAKGQMTYLFIGAMFFIPTVAFSVIRYLSLKYQIRDGQLTVTSGIFFRRVRTVPVERIQNIDLVQNVLHRIFGVAEVRVETASGTEPEATLRVLSLKDVEKLRSLIFRGAAAATNDADIDGETIDQVTGGVTSAAGQVSGVASLEQPAATEQLHRISLGMLLKAGLASNRGSVLIGVLIGLYFQFDLDRQFSFKQLEELLPHGLSTFQQGLIAVLGAIVVLACLRIFGIVWYILRFFGYKLTRSGNDLRISCGLFTKVSATVPRNRIQFISIHRNLFMRWMGLATIRIETAGGSSGQGEDATKSVSSRWFIPVLHDSEVAATLEQLRPGICWSEQNFDWQPLAPRAGTRMLRIAIVTTVLIAAAGFAITIVSNAQPWGWIAGVVALPGLIWHATKKRKSKKYARSDDCVVYRSGVLTHKTGITFFEKIQTLEYSQTPFDKRWGMATLTVDTAAAGPADHRIDIAYLSEEFAQQEFDELVIKAASHEPVFG